MRVPHVRCINVLFQCNLRLEIDGADIFLTAAGLAAKDVSSDLAKEERASRRTYSQSRYDDVRVQKFKILKREQVWAATPNP